MESDFKKPVQFAKFVGREDNVGFEHIESFEVVALRRGGITHALSEEWPMKAVGNRANVSETVLEMHYDSRSEEEKMEQRREYLDDL